MSWQDMSLASLADVRSGGGAPQVAEAFSGDGSPFVRAGSLVKLLAGMDENDLEKINSESAQTHGLKLFPVGTVLFAKSGMSATKGHIYALKQEAYVVNHLAALVPHKAPDSTFLTYALQRFPPTSLIKDSAYPSIRLGDIAEMKIHAPSDSAERERIAAILGQADAMRRKRREGLAHIAKLAETIFYDSFGDPKTNSKLLPVSMLGKHAGFYSGNTLPEGTTFGGEDGGYLILKVSDLNHPNNTKNITESAVWSAKPGSRAATCPSGSIVFPKRGGAIATNKKRILQRSAILDPNLMGVFPDPKVMLPDFLYGWFQSFNLSDISSGSTVPQLNKQDLAPLKIILPSLEAQRDYAQKILGLSELEHKIQNSLFDLEKLFDSLQHRAFSGEL